MPTDSNGVYSLPAGYLAVTGETVLASQHNPPLEDIAAALTGRMMTSGANPMTGPLKLPDGSVTAPSLTLASATSWGFYKTATGWGIAVAGANVGEFNPTALVLPKSLTLKDSGDLASANALTLGDGSIFNVTGTTAITSISTKGIGTIIWLRFAAALTLTHNATDLILPNSANITTAVGDWAVLEEYAAGDWRLISYHRATGVALRASLPRGYIDGCKTANGTDATNDIDFSAGVCRDSTNTVDITCAAMTKRLDADWAAGTNQGMREATGITNTTYHLFAIMKADGTQDWFAHTAIDPTAVLPSGYLYFRLVWSIVRLSNAIVLYTQIGDYCRYKAPRLDVDVSNLGTTQTFALTSVPVGLSLRADLNVYAQNSGSTRLFVYTPGDDFPTVPANNIGPLLTFGQSVNNSSAQDQIAIWTDTSAQIAAVATDATTTFRVAPIGFTHPRGKDS